MTLYPLTEPFERGLLDVGDGNQIAWKMSGSVRGKPAIVLHGGPGQGCSPNMRRAFDPDRYCVVLFDQRGCGQSTPHASLPSTIMACNTTHHLVADIEALRTHLGIPRWLVAGGSWGSTLALCYAQQFPQHVTELVLNTVTTSRRAEIKWLYLEVSKFFPEAWQRFRSHVPEATAEDRIIAAYAARLEHPDQAIRLAAACAWCDWEDAVLSLEPRPPQTSFAASSNEERLAFVRICTHFLGHEMWLDDDALLRNVAKVAHLPAVLIHGRRDMSCPVDTAWALARSWPNAELVIVDDAGHSGSPAKRAALLTALDRFAIT